MSVSFVELWNSYTIFSQTSKTGRIRLLQTWENSDHIDPETGAKGDNDPIDVVEIGSHIHKRGAVIQVRPLEPPIWNSFLSGFFLLHFLVRERMEISSTSIRISFQNDWLSRCSGIFNQSLIIGFGSPFYYSCLINSSYYRMKNQIWEKLFK